METRDIVTSILVAVALVGWALFYGSMRTQSDTSSLDHRTEPSGFPIDVEKAYAGEEAFYRVYRVLDLETLTLCYAIHNHQGVAMNCVPAAEHSLAGRSE